MSRSETYSFGEWVQQRREALHLTQRALAAAAHCSVPMLKKIEGDQRRPSPELAQLLAAALKVPAASQADFVAAARGERTVEALWALKFSDAQVGFQAFAPPPLPDQATTFIGRTDELGAIRERLREAGCRLLTLLGPGGIGKTRLAVKAAALQAAGEAAWPAVFVPLAAITEAVALPDAVARSLRLNLTGPTDQLVVSFLRHVRVLLILDNCEQLAGDLGWLATLLAEAPGVKVLATSRERLRLAEEWVYAVPNLAQAEALFVERARQVTPAVDAAAEQAAIQRICALVEQHPLAVELAAG